MKECDSDNQMEDNIWLMEWQAYRVVGIISVWCGQDLLARRFWRASWPILLNVMKKFLTSLTNYVKLDTTGLLLSLAFSK